MWKNSSKKKGKIVLVGGCFDILHPGHIIFLEKAKKVGDYLVVLLESDKKVRILKGINRPVHNQKDRAKVLSAIKYVDLIIPLPFLEKDQDYDQIIAKISPDVIATTQGALDNHFKKRSAKKVGAKLKFVTKMIGNHSSSKIINHYDAK